MSPKDYPFPFADCFDIFKYLYSLICSMWLLFQAGTVWCNCWVVRDLRMPFGGMKMSGIGREDQMESLDFYTEKKTICVQYTWENIERIPRYRLPHRAPVWSNKWNSSDDYLILDIFSLKFFLFVQIYLVEGYYIGDEFCWSKWSLLLPNTSEVTLRTLRWFFTKD